MTNQKLERPVATRMVVVEFLREIEVEVSHDEMLHRLEIIEEVTICLKLLEVVSAFAFAWFWCGGV